MALKIKLSKDIKNLLNDKDNKGLIPKVRRDFSKGTGPLKVKQAIIQDMIKGISPVQGKGKWKKYSEGYKLQIKNEAYLDPTTGEFGIFRRIGGKVRFIEVESKRLQGRSDVQKEASPTKKISPVNLRLSGGLHKSLKVNTKGGFLTNFRLVVLFKNKLADIHNRLGAGKSKVKRRLLPTNKGEKFNRKITTTLFNEVKKSVDRVVKEFSRQ